MKAITVWQPWASLLASGAKKYETRSYPISYRGPIAIHAAKKSAPRIFSELIDEETAKSMFKHLSEHNFNLPEDLPCGVVVATAEIVNCWYIVNHPGTDVDKARYIPVGAESMTLDKRDPAFGDYFVPSQQEFSFGNWTPGRYAWELANVKILENPIQVNGKQGLWNIDLELISDSLDRGVNCGE